MKKNLFKFVAVNLTTVLFLFCMGTSLFAQTGYNFFTDDCSSNAGSWTLGQWAGTNYASGHQRVDIWRYGSTNACGTTYMAINSYNGSSYTCDYNETDAAHDVYATRTASTAGWESIYIVYDWTANCEATHDYGNIGYSTDGTNYTNDANKQATAYGTWTSGVVFNISAVTAANNNSNFKIRTAFHADASVGPNANSGFGVDNIKLYGTPRTPAATFGTYTYACGQTTIPAASNSAPTYQTWYWQGTNSSGTSTSNPTTSSYTVTAAGTYYIRAYAGGTWSVSSQAITITAGSTFFTNPTISVTKTNETSPCLNNGTIQIDPSTTFSPSTWEYTMNNWTNTYGPTATDPYTYTSVAAGTYSQIYARYTIPSTSTKCTSTAGSATITEPAGLTATVTKTDVSCYGGTNGSISVSSPSGGTGSGYQASISPDPNSAGWISIPGTFSNLSAQGYTVTMRDNNGAGGASCSQSLGTTTVGGPAAAVSVSVNSSTNPLCYGSSNGSVVLNTATGGSGSGYMYAMRNPYGSGTWGSWQSGTTFSGLAAGTYGFKAKDGNSCESTEISRVITNPSALGGSKSGVNPSCYGGNNGTATITATGGTGAYQFSKDGGTNWVSGTSPYTFTGLAAGNYSLYVKDANSCTYTPGIQTLSNPTDISISSVTPTYVTCYGGSDGTISISASGGTGSLTYSIGGSYQSSGTFTGLTAGTYNITVKDANSCTKSYASNPVTVPTYNQLNATVNSTNSSCYDADDGTITFSGESGGTGEYNYSINGGSSWENSGSYTGLAPGTYNVAIQDLNYESCTRSLGTKVITEPALSNGGTLSGGSTPICYGSGTGTMTVSGYTGSIIKWQKKLGTGSWNDITNTNATYSETPSSAGTWYYRVAVQNGTGCYTAYSNERAIVVDNAVTASAGSDQNLTGTYSATLAGNTPSYGTGTWSKQSGSGNASYSPNANTPGAAVTVDAYDTYVFRWTVVNGTCSAYDEVSVSFSPNCSAISTFTGTGNWNDYTKWDNGVPTSCVNAVINGEVTVNVAGACNKLTVMPAKRVTISSGQSLTISDSLRLRSNYTGNASLIDLGTLSYPASKCEVQLTVTGTNAQDTLYHYYSAPVNSPSINAFWHFYMYNFDESIGDWVINYTNDIMNVGEGYAGYNSRNPFGVTFMVKYRGYSLNTGTQSFNLDYTSGNPDHFNLVGNPYPSAVDLDNVTFSNCDATVYFWNGTGTYAGQYGTYNLSTQASSQGGGDVLPAHNAIFVNALNSSANVTFNNDDRIHTSHAIYKSYNVPTNHMRLEVEANNYRDGLTIGLMDEATAGFDHLYDGRKLFGGYEMIPSLYSRTEDGVKVAINELPVQDHTIVPVEFIMGASGNYSLKAEDLNTFSNEYTFYLEDLASHSMINLRDNSTYTFSYNVGETADRFKLHINKSANGISDNAQNVNIYSYDRSVYINSDNGLNGYVNVYDVLGQEVSMMKLDGKSMYTINLNNVTNGYYMIQVTTENNTITKKVYIE